MNRLRLIFCLLIPSCLFSSAKKDDEFFSIVKSPQFQAGTKEWLSKFKDISDKNFRKKLLENPSSRYDVMIPMLVRDSLHQADIAKKRVRYDKNLTDPQKMALLSKAAYYENIACYQYSKSLRNDLASLTEQEKYMLSNPHSVGIAGDESSVATLAVPFKPSHSNEVSILKEDLGSLVEQENDDISVATLVVPFKPSHSREGSTSTERETTRVLETLKTRGSSITSSDVSDEDSVVSSLDTVKKSIARVSAFKMNLQRADASFQEVHKAQIRKEIFEEKQETLSAALVSKFEKDCAKSEKLHALELERKEKVACVQTLASQISDGIPVIAIKKIDKRADKVLRIQQDLERERLVDQRVRDEKLKVLEKNQKRAQQSLADKGKFAIRKVVEQEQQVEKEQAQLVKVAAQQQAILMKVEGAQKQREQDEKAAHAKQDEENRLLRFGIQSHKIVDSLQKAQMATVLVQDKKILEPLQKTIREQLLNSDDYIEGIIAVEVLCPTVAAAMKKYGMDNYKFSRWLVKGVFACSGDGLQASLQHCPVAFDGVIIFDKVVKCSVDDERFKQLKEMNDSYCLNMTDQQIRNIMEIEKQICLGALAVQYKNNLLKASQVMNEK